MRYDTDLRDTLRETTVPGTFLSFTVASTGHNLLFIRIYRPVRRGTEYYNHATYHVPLAEV